MKGQAAAFVLVRPAAEAEPGRPPMVVRTVVAKNERGAPPAGGVNGTARHWIHATHREHVEKVGSVHKAKMEVDCLGRKVLDGQRFDIDPAQQLFPTNAQRLFAGSQRSIFVRDIRIGQLEYGAVAIPRAR